MSCRVVVTLCAVVGIVTASTGVSKLEPKPDKYKNLEGCYISALDKVLPVGEFETSSDCTLYSCEKNWFSFNTCPNLKARPNCMVTTELSKPYPDCCPVHNCEDSDEMN